MPALQAIVDQLLILQPHPAIRARDKIAEAVPAELLLQLRTQPDLMLGHLLPGKQHIFISQARISLIHLCGLEKVVLDLFQD